MLISVIGTRAFSITSSALRPYVLDTWVINGQRYWLSTHWWCVVREWWARVLTLGVRHLKEGLTEGLVRETKINYHFRKNSLVPIEVLEVIVCEWTMFKSSITEVVESALCCKADRDCQEGYVRKILSMLWWTPVVRETHKDEEGLLNNAHRRLSYKKGRRAPAKSVAEAQEFWEAIKYRACRGHETIHKLRRKCKRKQISIGDIAEWWKEHEGTP